MNKGKEIKNVKDLKNYLNSLPAEADEWDVAFGTKKLKGLYAISGAIEGHYIDEVPESCTENFILLYNGSKP